MTSHTSTATDRLFINEVIVRTVENFRSHEDVVNFVEMASAKNIAVINLNVKQDEDDEVPSGYVFYKSRIAPIAPGYKNFDALRAVIAEAHMKGIQVRAWIPQFHDRAAILKNSAWQMMASKKRKVLPYRGAYRNEYFVNPLHKDVQNYERSLILEVVKNYDIDGIVLDWMRFDNFNMDMGTDTRTRYKAAFGYDPMTINFSKDNAKRRQWNDWRSTQLGEYVKSVRTAVNAVTPDLFLGVYVLPPEFVECGQDVAKFTDHVDFISPMAYFKDWGYDLEWVYDGNSGVLADTRDKGPDNEIIPAFDNFWSNYEYQSIYAGLRRNFPGIANVSYFCYGQWTGDMFKAIEERSGL
jgi:uncharacterized lipoprotein YddW (UPF0748 family)